MTTPLPPVDSRAVAEFWQRGIDAGALPADAESSGASPFGDSVELAEELITLILDGPKRATCGAVLDYETDGDPLPVEGTRWVAVDGTGRPRVALRDTDVRVGPLSSVDDAFAWDEGEGDRTRADWLRAHTRYFNRRYADLGAEFHPDIACVFERFTVEYRE